MNAKTARTLSPTHGRRNQPQLQPSAVTDSVGWLRLRLPTKLTAAVELLKRIHQQTHLLALYAEIFPAEYAASRCACLPTEEEKEAFREEVADREAEPHSAREIEFLELIDTRLFPLPQWPLESGRLYFIPVCTGVLDWGENDVESYGPSLGLAAALLSQEEWATVEDVHWAMTRERRERLRPRPRHHNPARERVEETFGAASAPLSYFPQALNLMNYTTGNVFADHVCEEGNCVRWFDWNRKTLEFLASEYREAQALFERINELDAWLHQAPRNRISTIIDLWNRSNQPAKRTGPQRRGESRTS